ncbi:MAG: hypothetical protein IPL65_16190 [Lewinellaceae bacterium]|nr:hypothetical protein [Lewinellaceae bacterium]
MLRAIKHHPSCSGPAGSAVEKMSDVGSTAVTTTSYERLDHIKLATQKKTGTRASEAGVRGNRVSRYAPDDDPLEKALRRLLKVMQDPSGSD